MNTPEPVETWSLRFTPSRLAWSPDGRRLAVGGGKAVAVVDAETGIPRWQVPESEYVRSLTFSPDGSRLAVFASTSDSSHQIRMLDATTGDELWSRAHATPEYGPPGGPNVGTAILAGLFWGMAASAIEVCLDYLSELVFSPDGRLLAFPGAVFDTQDGSVRIELPQDSTTERVPFPAHPAPAFSSDSRWLTALSSDEVTLRSASSGQVRWSTTVSGEVAQLAFDRRDERVLVVTYGDTRAMRLETGSGSVESDIPIDAQIGDGVPYVDGRPRLRLSQDRRFVLVHGQTQVGVFDTASGERLFEPHGLGFLIGEALDAVCARLDPAAAMLAVNRGDRRAGVTLLHAHSGLTLWEDPSDPTNDVSFSPDGTRLAVCGADGDQGWVRLYASGPALSSLQHTGRVTRVAATSRGMRLVAAAGADETVRIFHADSGEPMRQMTHPASVNSIAFSPDGQYLATGGGDRGARLYKTVSGERVWDPPVAHGRAVNKVVFVPPDGAAVVTASSDKTARLLQRDTGAEVWKAEHGGAVTHLAVSSDGRWVATGTDTPDRSTRIIDTATGEELFSYSHNTAVRALAFGAATPEGPLLAAAADETVLVVEVPTGREIGPVVRASSATAAALHHERLLLATGTGGFDRTIRLYDLTSGEPVLLRELSPYPAPIMRLLFNPATGHLVALGEDAVVRVLDPDTGLEMAHLTHPAAVNDIAISADGQLFATACDDGFARAFSGSGP